MLFRILIAAVALAVAPAAYAADRILPAPHVDGSNNVVFPGGPTLGTFGAVAPNVYVSAPNRLKVDALASLYVEDLHTNAASLGSTARLSGSGNEFSYCPQTGCDVTRDIIRAQFYLRGQSSADVTHAESQVSLDNYINTGYVPNWAASTAYSVGAIVSNNNKLFKVTAAGTSASSVGPTVTDPNNRGATVTDGSVTWTYISVQDDTDNKTTFSVTTAVGPNAGRTWGWATNLIALSGFKNQTLYGSEEDFHNLAAACEMIPANCFVKNMFVGGNTITGILQISPGGGIVPIASDGSSGGGARYGINIDGANTIRDVTFSDGTSASVTLKGWAGSSHRGGFILDQSTSPSTLVMAGTNATAALDDQSTSNYGVYQRGTYTTAAYRFSNLMIGNWGGDATYTALSFNQSFVSGSMLGFRGKAGDANLYGNVPTGGQYDLRVAGATAATLSASAFASTVPITFGNLQLGTWGGDASYKAITLNGSLASGAMSGLFGKSGDNGLYLAAPTFVEMRPAAVTALQATSSQVKAYVPVILKAYTVATLPACSGLQDAMAVVTDATAPTYRGALTGGGSVRAPVYCDGTSWTAH